MLIKITYPNLVFFVFTRWISNEFEKENYQTPRKLQVHVDSKWPAKYRASTWHGFIEMDTVVSFECISCFVLGLRSKIASVRCFVAIIRNTSFYWKWPNVNYASTQNSESFISLRQYSLSSYINCGLKILRASSKLNLASNKKWAC